MRQVTATGSTVEEAVQSALAQLETTEDQVEIKIIDEGKKGLFGLFGSRPVVVEVTAKPGAVESAEQFLQNIVKNMGIEAEIDIVEKDGRNVMFNISGEKMGLLIGKRGQTLNALQYLTQLVANRHSSHYIRVILNPEDYRDRRKETLVRLAERLASKATQLGEPVSLEPMPNYERKIIHTVLAENEDVETISRGEEPNRYVVIQPK
ncbi:RNA-binding cell elongation regulator Jag/EloR [Siminovitchia fortis]|uniref:RNA-binding protein KhpB n=1 Tax=Siminovitchia fortis TaxID=254758 RepID=A0A443IQ88_9BACI|nr:RNA-binding cell elongation regulator Jag/EloR [Siminovitchia fortis]RWR08943.1 protein jag [Siminovitchia fortis]WHY81376.1 RNA-binding cell elongation regulator Jag/EloR [Siminovitchia fortis]